MTFYRLKHIWGPMNRHGNTDSISLLFVDYAGYEITVRLYMRIPAEEVSRRFQGHKAARRTEQIGGKVRRAAQNVHIGGVSTALQ